MLKSIWAFFVGLSGDVRRSRVLSLLVFLFFTGFFSVVFFAGCLLYWNYNKVFDFTILGPVGDFFGGSSAPLIGIVGVVLTFAAFYVQYKANEQQKKEIAIERFQSRYFELMRLHKDNVADLEVGEGGAKRIGKRCFRLLIYEYHMTFFFVYKEWEKLSELERKKVDCAKLSYMMFYYGVGPLLSSTYDRDFKFFEKQVYKAAYEVCMRVKKSYDRESQKFQYLGKDYSIPYMPLDGHSTMLDSYYRHLYQMTRFVDKSNAIDDQEIKYGYMTTLRDQLCDLEQLMLFYNSVVYTQDHWDNLFVKYRFIKNLPLGSLSRLYVSPLDRYLDEMISLYLEQDVRLFERQGYIKPLIRKWMKANPEKYRRLNVVGKYRNVYDKFLD